LASVVHPGAIAARCQLGRLHKGRK
jgi:hypothetical protein